MERAVNLKLAKLRRAAKFPQQLPSIRGKAVRSGRSFMLAQAQHGHRKLKSRKRCDASGGCTVVSARQVLTAFTLASTPRKTRDGLLDSGC